MDKRELDFNEVGTIILKMLRIKPKVFSKGEIITTYIEKRNQICILLEGEADLIRYDFNGNKIIVEHFIEGSIFGELFYDVNTSNELLALAKSNSTIVFFTLEDLLSDSVSHNQLYYGVISNLLVIISKKIVEMNSRIEILSKRTIREKLLTYFQTMATGKFTKSFSLPFSLNDLADYLSIDRCAMMRELKSLREEGFIKKEGKRITLLY